MPTASAYVGRAKDLIEAGDTGRAIADIDEALRLDPEFFFAFQVRGDVYFKKREFAKSLTQKFMRQGSALARSCV
jgi:Tfp pilus assembly protein PilF